jgi:hypothetical protein
MKLRLLPKNIFAFLILMVPLVIVAHCLFDHLLGNIIGGAFGAYCGYVLPAFTSEDKP